MDGRGPDIEYLEELVRLGCKSFKREECDGSVDVAIEFYDISAPSKGIENYDLDQMRKIVEQSDSEALYGSS